MGLPELPNVSREQALTDLLESIALEETALAALIHAEAEKNQAMAATMGHGHKLDLNAIIDFQKSAASVIQTAIKMQMLLQFKLEKVLDSAAHEEPHKCKKHEAHAP